MGKDYKEVKAKDVVKEKPKESKKEERVLSSNESVLTPTTPIKE